MYIVRVPGINGLGKTRGCEKAPVEILKFLKEIYTNEEGRVIDTRLFDLEEIHLDNSNLEISSKLIYKNSFEAIETKPKTIFLGGDHSISFHIVSSFFDYCCDESKEPFLIVFDAHPDLMPVAEGATRFPTHEEWLRALVEKKGFPPENILLIGLRNCDQKEIDFLKKNKIKTISVDRFLEDFHDTIEMIMEFSSDKEIYVSIDIDVLDSAFAFATGYREPGGLTTRQLIYVLHKIKKIKTFRAADIVEINPNIDENGMTVKVGAKILAELV